MVRIFWRLFYESRFYSIKWAIGYNLAFFFSPKQKCNKNKFKPEWHSINVETFSKLSMAWCCSKLNQIHLLLVGKDRRFLLCFTVQFLFIFKFSLLNYINHSMVLANIETILAALLLCPSEILIQLNCVN